MNKLEAVKISDPVFGSCVKLTNGLVELLVTVDFGPRVISCSLSGYENLFYQDLSFSALGSPQPEFGGETLKLYGGHRIWISPEILPRCYYPDSAPVNWEKTYEDEDTLTVDFTAPVEKVNLIQKKMSITIEADSNGVRLEHMIKNCGLWEIELAPWCITMMAPGSKEVIPMPARSTGLLSNRHIALWDYSEMNDHRVYWGKDFITLTQDPGTAQPFKLGLNNEDGWVAIFNKGQVFFKHFEPELDELYPDDGCTYETYTNEKMLEAESLGHYVILAPGESVLHSEDWEIYKEPRVPSDDEAEIRKIIAEHLDFGDGK
ncbi:MAG: DUF4380 domain-containing protein [Clostridiales bacterium]|jgi:hypothetical protein|nr:DUF4380 domain-containing protein [Clostridiales bacterium]